MGDIVDEGRNEHAEFEDDLSQNGVSSATTTQNRYDLRPRQPSQQQGYGRQQQQYYAQQQSREASSTKTKVIPIPIPTRTLPRQNSRPPSPTAVLRHFGIVTYSHYELGVGHYSKVYKGFHQNDREIAIKVVKLNLVGAEFKKRFIPREREVWSKIRHRNICELFAILTCDEYGYLFMIMEYCHNGDLLTHIQNNGPLSQDTGRRWLRALLDAVNYLHRLKIAHRDIKAENVLISRRNNVKLTDFGFVCQLSDNFYSRTYCGSRAYSSPEVLKGTPYDVYKNDIWSFGVLCFVAMTNTMPFREDNNSNAVIIEQQRRRTYHWPSFITADCRESIDAMLVFYQDTRPVAKDVKKFPFFVRTTSATAPLPPINGAAGYQGQQEFYDPYA